MSIYDPATYPRGVPNPQVPHVHAWNNYPGAYGTRYHGSVWTQPMQRFPWRPVPMSGVGAVGLGLAEVPWPCWEVPGFGECHVACQQAARPKCESAEPGGNPLWVAYGYPSLQACVDEQARACDFQECMPRYCPEHVPAPRQGKTEVGAPGGTSAWLMAGGLGLGMIALAIYLNRSK